MSPLHGALFLPLVGWAFDAFESGDKKTEFRIYGPRWNERTCPVGRLVVLSRGYGKSKRLLGKVVSFQALDAPPDPAAWARAFGGPLAAHSKVAAIGIEVVAPMVEIKSPPGRWVSICDCTTIAADEAESL